MQNHNMANFVVQYVIRRVSPSGRACSELRKRGLDLHGEDLHSNGLRSNGLRQRGLGAVRECVAEEACQLVALLERIAAELSWQPGEQLRNYVAVAVHFAAYVDGTLAGGLQLVPSAGCAALPCERVWPEVLLPKRAQTAHISILAVRQEFRGTGGLLWPLCAAMWRYCVAHHIADISLEVTPNTYRLYRRLGWPLEIVGDLRTHWGEDCYLCRMAVTEVAGAMLMRAPRSAAYRDVVAMMSQPDEMSRPDEMS